jgi:pimeloyl-ACP methyl ester carboxylesterase
MRRLVIGGLALLAILIGGFFGIADWDIPYENLVKKYGQHPSQFVTLPSGLTAHYRDQGNPDGRDLLLIHGSNASLFTWEPWVRQLGEDYRVISVDLLGHGLSSLSPDHDYSSDAYQSFITEFVDAMGLDGFVLAGNSMGGRISWQYALEHGDQLEALILVDASGIPLNGAGDEGLLYQIAKMPVLNRVLNYVLPRRMVLSALRDAISNEDILTNEMVTQYHELLLREGRREASRARLIVEPEASSHERLSEITVPTLILWGKEDRLVSVEAAYEFDALIPGSTLIVYDGIGHLPMEEVAHQSAEDVRTFLTLH